MLQRQSLASAPSKPVLMDLLTSFLTEFAVMEGQLLGSIEIDSTPLLPRYIWDLYKWRISKGNIESSKLLGWEERRETVFATSLQHENLEWLSNLPLDAVVKLRNDGFLEDFRQKIRRSRKRLTFRNGLDFTSIAKEIGEEIESAISEHKESIKNLEREAHARIGMETARFLGKIWFKVASCWVPMLSLISSIGDGAEYVTKIKEDKRILDSLPDKFRGGPWGILMELKGNSNNKVQK